MLLFSFGFEHAISAEMASAQPLDLRRLQKESKIINNPMALMPI